ncbi:MAG TPA: class I SAM-dependent methyltransferase [Candidatus Dormibacteraeota bacterium]|nr:class I SAM-dependent methyltransferase [Candidatus Dormibacteraeota bacterium]
MVGLDVQSAERFREALTQAGYNETEIPKLVGSQTDLTWTAPHPYLLLRRITGQGVLQDLIRLYLCGARLTREGAAAALGEFSLEQAVQAGFLALDGDRVRSPLRIVPWDGLLFAFDGDRRGADVVTGVNPAAKRLACLTVRPKGDFALDLGTGCGIQALLAARHSRRVVGVDINPRALWFSDLNARLNGVVNFDIRNGSWFEPVPETDFDLIVANPPFVVSPDSEFLFRDSGLPGDSVCRDVIGRIPGHLAEGGYACVLCSWVQAEEKDWWSRPAAWAQELGCDVLIIRYVTEPVLDYAVMWNQELHAGDPGAYQAVIDRWLAYYHSAQIEAISTGVVVLRRRSTPPGNWVLGLDGVTVATGPSGDHLLRLFAAQDYLRSLPGEAAVLEEVLTLAEGHVLDQRLTFRDGGYVVQPSRMRMPQGIGLEGQVEPNLVQVLLQCDGQRRLGELVGEAAATLGTNEAELRISCLRTFRQLIELGFVVPSGRIS